MSKMSRMKLTLRNELVRLGSKPGISTLMLKAGGIVPSSRLDGLFGSRLLEEGSLDQAAYYLERAVEKDPTNDRMHYQLGLAYQRQQRYLEAIEQYSASIERRDLSKYYYHRGRCYESLEMIHDAIHDLFHAARCENSNGRAVRSLHSLIVGGPMTVTERIRYLTRGIEDEIGDVQWLVDLARLSFEQKLSLAAVKWYSRAEIDTSLEHNDLYNYGIALYSLGRHDQAAKKFAAAVERAPGKKKQFGVASMHAAKGNWLLAQQQFLSLVPELANLAEYYYQTGMALDRAYDFELAAHYYSLAVTEDSTHPYWYWRAGFAYERNANFTAAAKHYLKSAEMRPELGGAYDAGRMNIAIGNINAALECFQLCPELEALEVGEYTDHDPAGYQIEVALGEATRPNSALQFRTVGLQSFRQKMDVKAVVFLDRAARGLAEPDPKVFAALGFALAKQGRMEDAVQAYLRIRPRQRPDGVGRSVRMSEEDSKFANYLAYREELPIEETSLLYEVGHGSSISCNPLAIYRRAASDLNYSGFSHIWVTNGELPIPEDVAKNPSVTVVRRGTDNYYNKLATAKYLINNTSFGSYFIRRHEQKYLNTWHGTPHKTLGRSVRGETLTYGNISRNLLHATHLSAGNEWTARRLLEEHAVTGATNAQVAINGSPRLDILFTEHSAADSSLKHRLQIHDDKPLAVFVPTWRGTLHSEDGTKYSPDLDLAAIRAMEDAGYQVLYSAHRFVHESVDDLGSFDNLLPLDVDLYQVLKYADVLVTDYSSVWFDFLIVDKPIVFFQPDRDEYEEERGLYNLDVAGPVVSSVVELTSALRRVQDGSSDFSSSRERCREQYSNYEDGKAAERVLSWFVRGEQPALAVPTKPYGRKAIFRQSFIPNGIAASFRALSRAFTSLPDTAATVLVDRNSIVGDPERKAQLELLAKDVGVLPRAGRMMFTPEEKWLDRKSMSGLAQLSPHQEEILRVAYAREFERMFSDTNFDIACEFDGYSRFWTMVFSSANSARRKAVYLHNNMKEEHGAKHPELSYVFDTYKYFDSLLSVSESVNDENRRNLCAMWGATPERFNWANNLLDVDRIMSSSTNELAPDVEMFMAGGGETIVAVGRLSVEKAHDRLIRALSKLDCDLKLVIVGGGPEEENLRSTIRRL